MGIIFQVVEVAKSISNVSMTSSSKLSFLVLDRRPQIA